MPKQYDSSLNTLIDEHVPNWADFLAARCGIPPGPATPLDTDLSSTLQADRLFRIDGPTPAVLHLELEATGKSERPAQLLRYNVAAWGVTHLPVHTVLMVLRAKANATDLTGQLDLVGADGHTYLTFRYLVVRVWQESVDAFLAAGPGLASLSLLTNEAAADLLAAFARYRECLRHHELPAIVKSELLGLTFVLCGLRYEHSEILNLCRDVSMTLEESTTYQLILNKGRAEGVTQGRAEGVAQGVTQGIAQGRVEEARRLLIRFGTKSFGAVPANVDAAILAITDPDRLERLIDRLSEATGWDDLLATA